MNIIEEIEQEGARSDLPEFSVGDDVAVAIKVTEGERERLQIFAGTVIAKKGKGTRETFTVRRIVQGEGVERVFPIRSPSIASIEVTRKGKVRRSKLYYLRDRVGKATKVKGTIEMASKKASKRSRKRGRKEAPAEDTATGDAAEEKVPEENG